MKQEDKGLKGKLKISTRPIISLLIGLVFFTGILIVTMLVASEGTHKKRNYGAELKKDENTFSASEESSEGLELLAVLKEIDPAGQRVLLYDVEQQKEIELYYSGSTNIMDKYRQQIAVSQLQLGAMVEVVYLPKNGKIRDMQISTKAWEYIGVSNMDIDRSKRIMKIAANKYKYNDDILILDGEELVPVSSLAEQDELTVRGHDQTIWSITVTRGHGTVKLEDYEPFLGAGITIGYESMQQITEDLIITVREGNFNLTVDSGKFSATKNITVVRNQQTLVSLGDLGPEALKKGRVTFEISPFGADLFIDNELMFYGDPLELSYGEHSIAVSLGGYTTYKGKLVVDSAGKKIKIDLPEAASSEDITVTESEYTPGEVETDTLAPVDSVDPVDNSTGENNSEVDYTSQEDETVIDPDHRIYIQNPIGASVYLNGNFKGISPCDFEKTIGTYVLTFIEEGHDTMSYTIEVTDDGKDVYYSFSELKRSQD